MELIRACLVLVISINIAPCFGHNILGVFHTISETQFIVGSALMKELAARGHNVTVLSPFSLDSAVTNYKEIILDGVLTSARDKVSAYRGPKSTDFVNRLFEFYEFGERMTKNTFEHPKFRNLLSSKSSFDMVVLDAAMNEAMLTLGHHFNAPIVRYDTTGLNLWTRNFKGQPISLFTPYLKEPVLGKVSFSSRLSRVFAYALELVYVTYVHMPMQEEIYRRSMPATGPLDRYRNTPVLRLSRSLVESFDSYRSSIAADNIATKMQELAIPKKVQNFLDSASHGVIYVALDMTNERLSNETVDNLIETFGMRRENIIWNSNARDTMQVHENIMISAHIPEKTVIAHPKVKLVITEGELSTILNAAASGVPLIGITEFYDRSHNMALAVQEGFAVEVNLDDLDFMNMDGIIADFLDDSSFMKSAQSFARRLSSHSQPFRAVETTASLIEYMMVNPEASSRYTLPSQTFWEEYNVDVIAFLVILVGICIYFIVHMIKRIFVLAVLFYLNVNVKEKEL